MKVSMFLFYKVLCKDILVIIIIIIDFFRVISGDCLLLMGKIFEVMKNIMFLCERCKFLIRNLNMREI